jgi:hypothetical protein
MLVCDGEMGSPVDAGAISGAGATSFGGLAVYLASEASSYTTGEQFIVDGGCTKV